MKRCHQTDVNTSEPSYVNSTFSLHLATRYSWAKMQEKCENCASLHKIHRIADNQLWFPTYHHEVSQQAEVTLFTSSGRCLKASFILICDLPNSYAPLSLFMATSWCNLMAMASPGVDVSGFKNQKILF